VERHRNGTENRVANLPSRDETAALEAAGGNADLARELLETLVAGLPQELADLQRCFAANDWPLLAEAAHRMRGATSYCGIPAMDNHLQALERAAMVGDRELALESGMDDFLSKPIEQGMLRKALQRWVPTQIPGHGNARVLKAG